MLPSLQRGFHISLCQMGAHDAEFNQAKELLNTLKDDPGNDVKLKMYALFKQVFTAIVFKKKSAL